MSLSFFIWLFEIAIIILASITTGLAYHIFVFENAGTLGDYLSVGCVAAILYSLPFLFRKEYRIDNFLSGKRSARHISTAWIHAFIALAAIGFLTKTTGLFSRGWLLLYFLFGMLAIIAANKIITETLKNASASGRLNRRRLIILGPQDEIERALRSSDKSHSSWSIVATGSLPNLQARVDKAELDATIDDVIFRTRSQHVDDIVMLVDWAETASLEYLIDALMALPVSIHVKAPEIITRSRKLDMDSILGNKTLRLSDPPLSPTDALAKRSLDIILASFAILALSPLMVLSAILIKLDSRGPVFFRQRRRGYNQKIFRIWKFRTMTTLDDGDRITQASKNDTRVTRVGRWLRRTNIDELPQLFNVLAGEMSLIGPRPHAVAHDLEFEKVIAHYPRRLNVKPGITGWAQVHGYRGATETQDAIRNRVSCDIYYIENWSLLLDLYILTLTVLSPKAYRNAH